MSSFQNRGLLVPFVRTNITDRISIIVAIRGPGVAKGILGRTGGVLSSIDGRAGSLEMQIHTRPARNEEGYSQRE